MRYDPFDVNTDFIGGHITLSNIKNTDFTKTILMYSITETVNTRKYHKNVDRFIYNLCGLKTDPECPCIMLTALTRAM